MIRRHMMENIVFIDDSESFIIGSVIRNLEEMGFNCSTISWDVEDIKRNNDKFSDIVVAYIDDVSDIPANALIYLKDVCIGKDYRLYFVGYDENIDEIVSNYSYSSFAGKFCRPVNANDVAEKIATVAHDNPMLNRKHILVIDDSGTMLTTIQEWLGGKYRVSVVNSAMNAISFLDKSIPDLILLDYEMPGCSGPQLLEMLRADMRTENIPVIFLTGKDDAESVQRVLTLRPAGYLLKTMPKEYIIGQVDLFFNKMK